MARKLIIFILITVAVLAAAFAVIAMLTGGMPFGKAAGAVKVRTVAAEKGTISTYVTASGLVESINKAEIYIDTPVKASSVDVALYQPVKKGDRLFTLDTASIENELKKLRINRKIVELTPRSPTMDEKTGNELRTQNLKLIDLSISELEQRISELDAASISPIDGIIAELKIREGAVVITVQPAVTIMSTDTLQAKAGISEYDARSVIPGQDVRIFSDMMRNNEFIEGKVTEVAPLAKRDVLSGVGEITIDVTIAFDAQNLIMPGVSVTCDIFTDIKKDVMIVPLDVLVEDKDGNKSVFIVDTVQNTMYNRTVKIGITSEFETEIIEGLSEGEMVILDPQPSFKDGMRVNITNGTQGS